MNVSIGSEFCAASIELLDQSLIKIQHCIEQLNEAQIWWRPVDSMNSIGNLCVHLDGNLRQWGIVPFCDATDQREREKEFASSLNQPANELMEMLKDVVSASSYLWKQLNDVQLLESKTIQGFEVTALHAISHTSSHFVGHTHQIISLTRIQLGSDYRFQWTPDGPRDDLPI